MKPALKIEVSDEADLLLVTTEDGVIGFPAAAGSDPLQMMVLTTADYTNTPYKYFPSDLLPVVKACGQDWRGVYTLAVH